MRAQAHTLEGVAAALVVVLALAFALQATAVTPLTASTASQHIETQHERAAAALLHTERANGTLSTTLRYWNNSSAGFRDAGADGYYTNQSADLPAVGSFPALNQTFGDVAVAYNVNVYYVGPNGDRRLRRVVFHGTPSADAVAASRTLTLYDRQRLVGPDGEPTGPTLENSTYFAPDAPGPVYAVVDVEVVVWRM